MRNPAIQGGKVLRTDNYSGELLEATTYYPNGAVESQLTQNKTSVQLEPIGFTGKEADDEVGLVYFGERYLIPRVGRWASPDPLHVHAVGGGEALNSYHYVAGNLLRTRDPDGLRVKVEGNEATASAGAIAGTHQTSQADAEAAFLRDVQAGMDANEARLFEMNNGELVFTGNAQDAASDAAEFWVAMIEMDDVITVLPSTVLTSGDRSVQTLANGGAAFGVTSSSYSADRLKIRPSSAGVGVGQIRGATATQEGSVYVAYQTVAPGQRENQGRDGRSRQEATFRQAAISETLTHEFADHVVEFLAAQSPSLWSRQGHYDGWPSSMTTGRTPVQNYRGPTGAGLDALRRDSSPVPLERSIPLQRDVYHTITGRHGLNRDLIQWAPLYLQHQDQARFLRSL